MKLLLRGENQNPGVGHVGIDAALCATRCDAIELRREDVIRMWRMLHNGSEAELAHFKEMLNQWLCRFVPS
jgi:hypothetical protein